MCPSAHPTFSPLTLLSPPSPALCILTPAPSALCRGGQRFRQQPEQDAGGRIKQCQGGCRGAGQEHLGGSRGEGGRGRWVGGWVGWGGGETAYVRRGETAYIRRGETAYVRRGETAYVRRGETACQKGRDSMSDGGRQHVRRGETACQKEGDEGGRCESTYRRGGGREMVRTPCNPGTLD